MELSAAVVSGAGRQAFTSILPPAHGSPCNTLLADERWSG